MSFCCLVLFVMVSSPLPRFPGLWPLLPGSISPLSRVKSLVLWVHTWQLDWCDFWDSLRATGSLSSCLTLPLELPPPCTSDRLSGHPSCQYCVPCTAPLFGLIHFSLTLLFLVNVLSINYHCLLICIWVPFLADPWNPSLTFCLKEQLIHAAKYLI